MSNEKNFRVSVSLGQFFHDHRQRARIFINDAIKTISDLEKRIEKIFNIKNFHLASQNEYLPPNEDVRILQKDDIIWVVRNSHENVSTTSVPTPIVNSTKSENLNKNKKRSVPVTEESCLEEDLSPPKKKKKKTCYEKSNTEGTHSSPSDGKHKKKKNHEIKNKQDQSSMIIEVEVEPKEKKKKKDKHLNDNTVSDISQSNEYGQSRSNAINTLLPVLQSHIDSYNKKVSRKFENMEASSTTASSFSESEQNLSQPQLSKSLKEPNICKGTLSSYKRKVSIPTITDKYLEKKKINIVKIEYLSGGPEQLREMESATRNSVSENEPVSVTNVCNGKITIMNNENSLVDDNSLNASNKNECSLIENINLTSANQNLLTGPDQTDQNTIDGINMTNECNDITNATINVIHEDLNKSTANEMDTKSDKQSFLISYSENSLKLPEADKLNSIPTDNVTPTSKTEINDLICTSKNSNKSSDSNYGNVSDVKCFIDCKESAKVTDEKDNILKEFKEEEAVPKKFTPPNNEINKTSESNICHTTPESATNVGSVLTITKEDLLLPNSSTNEISKINHENEFNGESRMPTHINNHILDNHCDKKQSKSLAYDFNVSQQNNTGSTTGLLEENISSISTKEFDDSAIMNETINCSLNLTEEMTDSSVTNRKNSSIFSTRKQLSGIGQLLGELRSNESAITGESMDSDHSEFITKRRRRRIRKRRKKIDINEDTSFNESSIAITSNFALKPLKTKACPMMHLKFEEEEDGDRLKVVDVTKKDVSGDENNADISCIESITIESDGDTSNNLNSFNIKEEHILKSPSIKNLSPRIGDIIAFKILRITENYTPEISLYIIGKVIEFNTNNKVVLFEILNGLDQCEEPVGKLTTETVENNSINREFAWTDIIDPRLLFP